MSDPAPDEPTAPTTEQIEARARRADKATRGALAAIVAMEGLIVLLVPRAIAFTDTGLGGVRAAILIALGVVMMLAAGVQRRLWGIAVGSVLQVLFVLTGVWLTAMFVVGVIFVAIWLYLLNLRHELVGTPGGWRLLVS